MIQGCTVCFDKTPKYKCPKCYVRFCSVGCGQTHKETGECSFANREQPSRSNPLPAHEDPELTTEDTVPPERLAKLGESSKLVEMLKNGDLQHLLRTLDSSSTPEETLERAMKDPAFRDFVDVCLDVVEEPSAS